MNAKKVLDQDALKIALDGHDKLIATLLRSEERHRFLHIQQIAKLSELLLGIDSPRIGDFDSGTADVDVFGNGNVIMGRNFMQRGAGVVAHPPDQMDLIRTAIDMISPIAKAQGERVESEIRANQAEELKSLTSVPLTDEIYARIEYLRKQIGKKETDNALVSTQLLRGHPTGESEQDGQVGADEGLMAAPD